jgi:simple sugar transport system permease protein
MQLFMGIAIVITEGKAVLGFPEIFSNIGNGTVGGIPIPMIIFTLIAILISIILTKTSFGIRLYMMGTNPVASKFSGINNTALLFKTYLLSGILAATSGLIIIARVNSAKADYGTSYTLQAVLVAVMGGVNPNGGFGKIIGIIMAMFTLQFLSSGFNALHFSNFFKDFIWGVVLILVMIVNYITDTLKSRSHVK